MADLAEEGHLRPPVGRYTGAPAPSDRGQTTHQPGEICHAGSPSRVRLLLGCQAPWRAQAGAWIVSLPASCNARARVILHALTCDLIAYLRDYHCPQVRSTRREADNDAGANVSSMVSARGHLHPLHAAPLTLSGLSLTVGRRGGLRRVQLR